MAHSDGVKPVHETLLSGVLSDLANAVCVKRIFGWGGKGKEAESAWHFLLYPSFPQRTNFEALVQYGVFIKKGFVPIKRCAYLESNKRRTFQTL